MIAPNDSASTDSTATAPFGPVEPVSTIRWSYYPNPTAGIVHITAEVDIPELYITDPSGKVLQRITALKAEQVMQVDLSAYATGIYLIRYPYGKSWLSGRVVLQR